MDALLSGLSKRYNPSKAAVFQGDALFRFLMKPTTGIGELQDLALATFAFFGCLRACELIAIALGDIEEITEGYMIRIVRFKTSSKSTRFLLPFKLDSSGFSPGGIAKLYLDELTPWLKEKKIDRIWPRVTANGPVAQVRGHNHITLLAKKIASFLGLDPGPYTGHSFRRTSATSAADGGISLINLKRFGGWKSDGVASSYVDDSKVIAIESAGLLPPRLGTTEPGKEISDSRLIDSGLQVQVQRPGLPGSKPDAITSPKTSGEIIFNITINQSK